MINVLKLAINLLFYNNESGEKILVSTNGTFQHIYTLYINKLRCHNSNNNNNKRTI